MITYLLKKPLSTPTQAFRIDRQEAVASCPKEVGRNDDLFPEI